MDEIETVDKGGQMKILTKEEFYDLLCPMTDDDERKIGRPRWF